MWRKTACAAAGLALAFAAAYGFNHSTQSGEGSLDLSVLYPRHSPAKADRLPITQAAPGATYAIAFNLPHHAATVVAKQAPSPKRVTLIHFPRDRAPAQAVEPQPQPELARQPELPEGCEPSFSPVTTPALAHIAGRCMS